MDDAAIHRVSGNAGGFVCSFIASQWIATGLRPRDGKVILKSRDLRGLQWLLWHCTGMRTDPSGYPAGIF